MFSKTLLSLKPPRTLGQTGSILVLLCVVAGCGINPLRVAPKPSITDGSKCTKSALAVAFGPGGKITPDADASAESRVTLTALQAHVTMISKALAAKPGVPKELEDNNVVLAIRNLITYQHLSTLENLVRVGAASGDVRINPTDLSALLEKIGTAKKQAAPSQLTNRDFKEFFKRAVELKSSDSASRTLRYESYYFNGTFVDRFGNQLSKPTLSLTITDQEINGSINALIEAIADDLFANTPVWVDSITRPNTYYPGATPNVPSAAAYEKEVSGTNNFVALDVATSGHVACGMTLLKSEVLTYLAGKAGTWASGESGAIVGAFGGANVGLPIILGKISIGDNKVVTAIVQTVLSTAVKRAAFQATIPILLAIPEPANSKFVDILKLINFSGKT